jgi:hypothetical protein
MTDLRSLVIDSGVLKQLGDSDRLKVPALLAAGVISLGALGDVSLVRDAANALAIRDGANAQTLNIYNNYADSSNYERGFARWNSNVFEIGTAHGGSGGAKHLRLLSDGGVTYIADSTGGDRWFWQGAHQYPATDNVSDIGDAVHKIRNLHIGTAVVGYAANMLQMDTNNVVIGRQRSANGSSYLPLPYIDGEDRLRNAVGAGVVYVGPSSGAGGTYPYTFAAFQATSVPIPSSNNSTTTLIQAFMPVVNFTTANAGGFASQSLVQAFNLQGSVLAGDMAFVMYNTDNTYGYGNTSFVSNNTSLSTASSNVGLRLLGRQFGGDQYVRFDNQATALWQIGLDNNDGARFKLSNTQTLGSGDRLAVDQNGTLTHNVVWPASSTFTATTAIGSTQLTGTSFVGNVYVGATLSGTGIPAGTTVVSVAAQGIINMSQAATAAGTITVTTTNSSATLTAHKINVTDSGVGSGSLLFDVRFNNVSQFSVGKDGGVWAPGAVGIGLAASPTDVALRINKSFNNTAGAALISATGFLYAQSTNIVNNYGLILQPIYRTASGFKHQSAIGLFFKTYLAPNAASAATVAIDTVTSTQASFAIYNIGTVQGTITDANAFVIGSVNNEATGSVVNFTNLRGLVVSNLGTPTGFAGVTVAAAQGVAIMNQSGGTNNYNLHIGGQNVPAAGNWSIYNESSYPNYFAGTLTLANAAPLIVGVSSAALDARVGTGAIRFGAAQTVAFAAENTTASGAAAGAAIGVYSNDNAAMVNGDRLGLFLFGGSSGVGSIRNSAALIAYATETWNDNVAHGTRFAFEVTANGSNARVERMSIEQDGIIKMTSLPTSNPNIAGALWNNAGVVNISAG